jgi:Leucine-rich repeat (LRR) protein
VLKSNDDNQNELLLSVIQWAEENGISEYIVPRDIEKLKNLTTLKLGSNATSISHLPEAIGCLTNLTEIFIGGYHTSYCGDVRITRNEISRLPDSIGLLKNLTKLEIERCSISTLPESIGQLSNLRELFLYLNEIKNLPESIGNLRNLKKLILGYNKIRELPESVGRLLNLQELIVCSNKLSKLPESIGNLRELNKLDVGSNELEELPTSLFNLVNLKELDLSSNLITELSDSISNLSELDKISMARNPFQKLPTSLDLLTNLSESEKNNLAKVVESSEEFSERKKQKRYFELCSDREKKLDFCDWKTRELYRWTSFLSDPPALDGYAEVKTFKSKLNRQNNVEEKFITVLQKDNRLIAIHNDGESQKEYRIPYEWKISSFDWEKKEAIFQFVIGRTYWLYLAMDFETAIDFLTVMGVYPNTE